MAVATPDSWTSRIDQLEIPTQAFIDGDHVDAESGQTFECVSPIDGRILANVASCDTADVDRAVRGARAAFESGVWSRLAPKKRKKVLQRLAALIEEHADELALLETLDMGKPIRDARAIDVPLAAETIAYYGEALDKIYDEVAPTDPSAVVMVVREPLGVIGAVVPWNFPLLMATWKIGPALATGNSVILKPAEQSPLTALRLGQLAAEAGIPDGVLQVVPGLGETAGQAIGLHMDVDMVAFTGSTEVGKFFLRYSGESNMKRVALECGGKSPHIVMPDCSDLDGAATAAAWGIFFNQGEVCNAGSRLLVHESVKDEFLEKVTKVASRIQPGDPLDPSTRMGALVDSTQLDRVLGYIESGKDEGADLYLGGSRVRTDTGGYYVEPTIFDTVSKRHDDRARGDLRPCALDDLVHGRSRGDQHRERHHLRSCRGGLDGRREPCASHGTRTPGRGRLGQHVRHGRHLGPVRRLQAVRLRAGQVDALAREVHGSEDDLDPAPLEPSRREKPAPLGGAGPVASCFFTRSAE